jgi:DNA-binding MarR family transcriptional regulator
MSSRDEEIAQLLLGVTRMVMNNVTAQFRHADERISPPHVGILAVVNEGECTLSDLAQRLCVKLPTISRSISLLVERGLIERRIPESNRRTTMIRLTRDGKKLFQDLTKQARASAKSMLGPLSAAEQRTVQTGLQLLAKAFARLELESTKSTGSRKEALRNGK